MAATKIRRIVDIRVECEVPRYVWRNGYPFGSPEYWKCVESTLQDWVKDFHDFIRDHRSQDPVNLSVEPEYQEQCSECGCEWETMIEGGVECCAGCGAVCETEAAKEARNGKE